MRFAFLRCEKTLLSKKTQIGLLSNEVKKMKIDTNEIEKMIHDGLKTIYPDNREIDVEIVKSEFKDRPSEPFVDPEPFVIDGDVFCEMIHRMLITVRLRIDHRFSKKEFVSDYFKRLNEAFGK
jgi:hypothetical protein